MKEIFKKYRDLYCNFRYKSHFSVGDNVKILSFHIDQFNGQIGEILLTDGKDIYVRIIENYNSYVFKIDIKYIMKIVKD